jgi:hypothetical protein
MQLLIRYLHFAELSGLVFKWKFLRVKKVLLMMVEDSAILLLSRGLVYDNDNIHIFIKPTQKNQNPLDHFNFHLT